MSYHPFYHHHLPAPPATSHPVPEAGITEIPGWSENTRIIVLTTSDGVRQWRCEGLASNVTPESLRLLGELLEQSENRAMLGVSEPASELRAPARA